MFCVYIRIGLLKVKILHPPQVVGIVEEMQVLKFRIFVQGLGPVWELGFLSSDFFYFFNSVKTQQSNLAKRPSK